MKIWKNYLHTFILTAHCDSAYYWFQVLVDWSKVNENVHRGGAVITVQNLVTYVIWLIILMHTFTGVYIFYRYKCNIHPCYIIFLQTMSVCRAKVLSSQSIWKKVKYILLAMFNSFIDWQRMCRTSMIQLLYLEWSSLFITAKELFGALHWASCEKISSYIQGWITNILATGYFDKTNCSTKITNKLFVKSGKIIGNSCSP